MRPEEAVPVDSSGDSAGAPPAPGRATFAELDDLLARAASEVQHGLDEGSSRVGRYTLVTPVGEGGFGTVWLASQEEPVRRVVALKLLRRDPGSRMVVARFQNERQALARMDHPNVATVLDAGVTEDGRPWFVMPFIDGLPINTLCDERRLPVHDRVRLFLGVCDGVQHAHQKGVIHRDLKPGNVLVTRSVDEPAAKVIDFGVAKALDLAFEDSLRTADGQRLGTPQYMPPEQWCHGAATADARSDVYALGVILAELLVGGPPTRLPRTPLDVPEVIPPLAWLADSVAREPTAATAVAERRGTTVAGLAEVVRGDLDAIVRRACAAHPEDRYVTAAALADDLRRWLAGQPVAARLLAPWERAWRTVRRHRLGFALAAVAVLAVAASIWVWADAALRAHQEHDRAVEAMLQQERTFGLARSMIDDMVAQQRSSTDPLVGRSTFARVEALIDRIAVDDPVTAARLATLVAHGHEEAWDHASAYALLRRSFAKLVVVDPGGATKAFAELAPEVYRMALHQDRMTAASLAPYVFASLRSRDGLLSSEGRQLFFLGIFNRQAWPFMVEGMPWPLLVAAVDRYASMEPDPRESARLRALGRVYAFSRADRTPGRSDEMLAALDLLRRELSQDDPELVIAETQTLIALSLDGFDSEDLVQAMAMQCRRAEYLFGDRSPRTVNAHWNLAYMCAHLGMDRDAYDAYARFLWPEYRRQVPTDGLRKWYLAYFSPIAFQAGDLDTAYAAAATQLADDVVMGVPPGHESTLSARVLASVLAAWGDEQGAAEVERWYGVTRVPACPESW